MQLRHFFIKIFICIFLFFALISNANAAAKNNATRNQLLQQKLSQLIYQYHIPGIVLTYGFNNEPLQTITVGYRDLQQHEPMHDTTLFNIGSVTKSFIGAAILEQIEAGKITVDENLNSIAKKYGSTLAKIIAQYPSLGDVTIRQLLDHNSGVPEDVNTSAFTAAFKVNPKRIWTTQDLIKIAMQKPFFFKPGTPGRFNYTNTDYLLLDVVLESVTHQTISVLFNQLESQAGLQDIYYFNDGIIPSSVLNKMAIGYSDIHVDDPLSLTFTQQPQIIIPSASTVKGYVLNNAYNVSFLGSAGGMISNTFTLAQWYRALFQNDRVLNKASIDMMLKGGMATGKYHNAQYGFGVATYDSPQYGYFVTHDGKTPGYTAVTFYFFKYGLVLTMAANLSQVNFELLNSSHKTAVSGIVKSIIPILLN